MYNLRVCVYLFIHMCVRVEDVGATQLSLRHTRAQRPKHVHAERR